MRRFFGDAVGLAILAGISLVALVLLLGCVRLYRVIPTDRPAGSREVADAISDVNTERGLTDPLPDQTEDLD